MSWVSLVTADVDQAFEACSSSAVLPAWGRISQTYESRFSSNYILFRRARRELCKRELAIIWSLMAIVYHSGLGPGIVQFHVRFIGHVGLHV